MSSTNDLMDIMGSSTENKPASSTDNIKKQLYNAIGDKIPSLKLNKPKQNVKKVGKWIYSNKIKSNRNTYEQWIKLDKNLDQDTNVSKDISHKFNQYIHQYKIPYFVSREMFDESLKKYKDSLVPSIVHSLNQKYLQELEVLKKVKMEQLKKDNPEAEANEIDEEKLKQEFLEPDYTEQANTLIDQKLKYLTFEIAQKILDLAKIYDLKWIVIQDRFNVENQKELDKELSVSEIRYIFYKSCLIYFQYNGRYEMNDLLNFSLQKDLNRKHSLDKLFNRSAAEVAEEEALILEARKFEVTSKKIKEERDSIVKLLDYPKTATNFIPEQFLSAAGFSQLYKNLMKMRSSSLNKNITLYPENPWQKQFSKFKSQKRKIDSDTNETNNEASPMVKKDINLENEKASESNSKKLISTLSKRAGEQKVYQANSKNEMIYELVNNLTDFEKDKMHLEINSDMYTSSGIMLNSNKLATNKASVENKVDTLLNELGLPTKPIMNTTNVIKGYNTLNSVLLECISIKQSIDKLTAEEKISK
ncbi:uncharacterized protein HGUI_01732 [Hanseniaspora guilliermondii]|uniref:SWR1-complex protein 4 n=1 Tax=Hanseniaspora guilliermondii TaxID=56406 RepID=A0A1L0B163_9ASCO|nr:uncharacterized protein HGUI_01732 [Hanseniaspora guilliermondii]